ncbi:MarR family winged helix-turn-helix transcriptional regulator [Thiohalobacter sp. IOR34]|uniref:MarR family winged helix-turn-helix transcriptional regulator n=1 Tax=Thiohalobacter sp. IOR34 TaxID=3057176 RepID=UPI0025B19263|nr:MarR family winged helix-turn-helix transcriptional regulator [Thiohalobacter sp. IOR34]WJW76437.1 MarR family winged helix-turn-helix transcriptional regulator [Thiohalobacter sp. IOR34]
MVDAKASDRRRIGELNAALEALHFGFRALTAHPDERLARLGYSRVHHRVLYFIARNPECSINELLDIMRVSKQYLHRPLRQLIDDGLVVVRQDLHDRRVKRLRLTPKGKRLEATLTGEQRKQLARVFDRAGPEAEAGWRQVMALLADEWPARGEDG